MEKPSQEEISSAQEIVNDLHIAFGESGFNRAARRAAKARLQKKIKQAKKKLSAQKSV